MGLFLVVTKLKTKSTDVSESDVTLRQKPLRQVKSLEKIKLEKGFLFQILLDDLKTGMRAVTPWQWQSRCGHSSTGDSAAGDQRPEEVRTGSRVSTEGKRASASPESKASEVISTWSPETGAGGLSNS